MTINAHDYLRGFGINAAEQLLSATPEDQQMIDIRVGHGQWLECPRETLRLLAQAHVMVSKIKEMLGAGGV